MSPQHFHFLGICGSAMGSVASALRLQGHQVTGSDANPYPPMSTFLESQGIEILSGYSADHIPNKIDTIIVGNAISRGNEELEAVLEKGLHYVSLPEILKTQFLRHTKNIVVSGTHGKTTTSSLTAWILKSAGINPNWMIGGIPSNLEKGAHLSPNASHTVLEGDEYDTAFFDKRSKFVHYLPSIVIVNNMEFDHADIFNSLEEIQLSFSRMLALVPRNGSIFINGDETSCLEVAKTSPVPVTRVGTGNSNDILIDQIRYEGDTSHFSINGIAFSIPMTGEHNIRNAAMAICAARTVGVSDEKIKTGLTSFTGIKRRQTLRGEVNNIRVIDDFGHHPTAIEHTLNGLKAQYPTGKFWALFEPRSNTSRRNIHQETFPKSLAIADGAIIAPVNDINKIPKGERLDVPAVAKKICNLGKQGFAENSTEEIIERTLSLASPGDTIVVFSNGSFDGIHDKLLERLAEKS